MSSTNMPFGFRPAYSPSGIIRPSEFPDAIASGFASNILVGQPVKLVAGFFQPITATTDQIYGVFAGCEGFATLGATTKFSGWSAGQTYVGAGSTSGLRVWVHTDPTLVYEVQATGPAAQTILGSQVVTTNITAGNVTSNPGLSGATVAPTSVGVGVQGQWMVTDVNQGPDNAWGDNFTILQVTNAYPQGRPFVTSIG